MSKWAGQYSMNDPPRATSDAREQIFPMADIEERAARGEAPGSCPGRFVLRPGVWNPQFRTAFPPAAAYKDDQT
eukprot:15185168-Alexandrium_andersonii.AAC.1